MTYILERLGEAGMVKIKNDLASQSGFDQLEVERFVLTGTNETWAVDRRRNRYMHRIRFITPPSEVPYHYFNNGVSLRFTIGGSLFDTTCQLTFIDKPKEITVAIAEIQEVFDTYGRSGRGPDDDEFSRVTLVGERNAD